MTPELRRLRRAGLWFALALGLSSWWIWAGMPPLLDSKTPLPPPSFPPDSPPPVTQALLTATKSHARRYRWDEVETWHVVVRHGEQGPNNGFPRGRDLAALLPDEHWRDARAAESALDSLLDDMAHDVKIPNSSPDEGDPETPAPLTPARYLRQLHAVQLEGAGRFPRFWSEDLVLEIQGLGAGRGAPTIQALQQVALATNMNRVLCGAAFAARSEQGPALIARYRWGIDAPVRALVPLFLYEKHWTDANKPNTSAKRRLTFMLTPFGVSVPIAGMNLDGLALARFAPSFEPDAYMVAIGPDATQQARIVLTRHDKAGLESGVPGTGDFGGAGAAIRGYCEPDQPNLARMAAPGIVLAVDRSEAWRYEWKAVGNNEWFSSEFEFERLDRDFLPAGPIFLHPDHQRNNDQGARPLDSNDGMERARQTAARKLLADTFGAEIADAAFRAGGPEEGDSPPIPLAAKALWRLVRDSPQGTVTVAMFPRTGVIYLNDGAGKVAEISLHKARALWWEPRE